MFEIESSIEFDTESKLIDNSDLNEDSNKICFVDFSVDGAKRDAEFKLGSIVSSLRRSIGYGPRGRSPSPTGRRRPISPTRGLSTAENRAAVIGAQRASRTQHQSLQMPDLEDERSHSPSATFIDVTDVDPEQIRGALRDFVQNFLSTERERDDCVGSLFN